MFLKPRRPKGYVGHAEGCHICGAYPNNPTKSKSTSKLYKCGKCSRYTCHGHVGKGLQNRCPFCDSTNVKVVAREMLERNITKGSAGEENEAVAGGASGGGSSATLDALRAKRGGLETPATAGMESAKALELLKKINLAGEDTPAQTLVAADTTAPVVAPAAEAEAPDALEIFANIAANLPEENPDVNRLLNTPRYTCDAWFGAEDAAGLARLTKEMTELKDAPSPQPVPIIAVSAHDVAACGALLQFIENTPWALGMVGYAAKLAEQVELQVADAQLTELFNTTDKLVAMGPVGLDAHFSDDLTAQHTLLTIQLDIAADFGLPVVLYQHDALNDLTEALSNFARLGEIPALVYTGVLDAVAWAFCQKFGCFVAVDAGVTWPERRDHAVLLAQVPANKLLLASGSITKPPYSLKGQWNSPLVWHHTFEALTTATMTTKHIPFHHQLNRNFLECFYGESDEEADELTG
ncbi:MAG: TatD family hydrolase [Alphaproteobacteria bacterium]